MAAHPIIAERKLEALRHALGDTVLAALVEPAVVEILANPDGRLILDRSGEGRRDTGATLSAEARERVVRLIADYVGETVTRDDPRLSGVLPGTGERFQGLLPPVTAAPAFSIRKRPAVIWTLEDYVAGGTMTEGQAGVLRAAATGRLNILISGGTGSGKTTLLNTLTAFIDPTERVVTCEDAAELQLQQPHVVRLETRPPNLEGQGQITMRDLVKNCLRMRPERIIVGEVRGPEAFDLLQAMNTGHDGSMGTLHANSPREAVSRLESMITM
ncbi:MAG: ATPase, T2SS/T4P/T4SS family, partial [Brevundimonas sp.]|uniref:CpaF family protein n=1 Tax=Brevundimonas sp. TaxID=1871086 RepID=UPI0027365395